MYSVGSIINVKKLIFKKYDKYNNAIDHCYESGRPCLVICEDSDHIYFLKITGYKEKTDKYLILLSSDDLIKQSCVNICDIYCRNIAFYRELSRIDDKELYDILIKFVNYQEHIKKDENYDKISGKIKSTIEELFIKLEQKQNKGQIKMKRKIKDKK